MTRDGAARGTTLAGPGALEQALAYALAAATAVTPELLARPTPCHEWDLRMLLLHVSDSADALIDGLTRGQIDLRAPAAGEAGNDPALYFASKVRALLASCLDAPVHPAGQFASVVIGGCPMPAALLVATGTLEIAVHGWDIFQSCGHCQPIPEPLARGLLSVAPILVTTGDRHSIFAAPPAVPAPVSSSDQLIAYLGRSPLWSPLSCRS